MLQMTGDFFLLPVEIMTIVYIKQNQVGRRWGGGGGVTERRPNYPPPALLLPYTKIKSYLEHTGYEIISYDLMHNQCYNSLIIHFYV